MRRQPLLPRVLSVAEGAAVARRPFKPPCRSGYSDQNGELVRRLWIRKKFVPWGSSRPALFAITNCLSVPIAPKKDVVEEIPPLPPGVEPLVLWLPEDLDANVENSPSIVVDPLLVRFLRPHQRLVFEFSRVKLWKMWMFRQVLSLPFTIYFLSGMQRRCSVYV